MEYRDKTLECRDCRQPFIFSAGEQEFFAAKNLYNEPKRCPNCRIRVKMVRDGRDPQTVTEVPCSECQTPTVVPFKPTGIKPVLCTSCMHAKKDGTVHENATVDLKDGVAPDDTFGSNAPDD